MNVLNLGLSDLIGFITGFLFTLMVLSYLVGDNPLFRFAMHVFVGVSAGYIVIVTISNVILPQMVYPLIEGKFSVLTAMMWAGAFFLMFKAVPKVSRFGNGVMAYLVGVGVAVAIGGAVLGTIFPQSLGTIRLFDQGLDGNVYALRWEQILNGMLILIGTLSTLVYFRFHLREHGRTVTKGLMSLRFVNTIGQFFIAVTFGVLFVGVYIASVSALIERFVFIREFLKSVLAPVFRF